MQQDLEKKSVTELTQQVEGLTRQVANLTQHTRGLEERAFDLYTICQVGRAFTGDNPVKISEVLVAAMSDRIGANRALVLLARQPRGPFRPIYAHGLPNEVVQKICFQPRQGILWQLLKAGEPFAVADSSGQTLFPREFEESNLDQAGICYWVPLLAKDEVLGVVCLDKTCDSEAEARFFYLLASQGATALDNARLYQELQTSKRDLGYQMNKLAMLYDVGRALNVIDDRNRLLTEILGRAAAIAEAEKGSIMLFDEGSDELVVQVVRGIDPETEQKILNGEIVTKRLKRGEGVAGQVAATGTPMVVNNVFDGPQFVRSLTSRVNSILCVPLRVHGDVIGVLNITNKFQGKTFSDADLQIIQQVADQAAVAIHNARLYEMAVTDSLTHLYIRRHLFHRLSEEMRRARRYSHPVSLLMVDIDHFKSLNDSHGHPLRGQGPGGGGSHPAPFGSRNRPGRALWGRGVLPGHARDRSGRRVRGGQPDAQPAGGPGSGLGRDAPASRRERRRGHLPRPGHHPGGLGPLRRRRSVLLQAQRAEPDQPVPARAPASHEGIPEAPARRDERGNHGIRPATPLPSPT